MKVSTPGTSRNEMKYPTAYLDIPVKCGFCGSYNAREHQILVSENYHVRILDCPKCGTGSTNIDRLGSVDEPDELPLDLNPPRPIVTPKGV